MSGMSGHERPIAGETDVWLTPRHVIDLLGPFDMDPCAATNPPWPTAKTMFTVEDDGLAQEWQGLVWLNPPYSQVWKWLDRLAEHRNGIALIFARTETKGFHKYVWNRADMVVFPEGRIKFHHPDGTPGKTNAGAPSCFVGYGLGACLRLKRLDGAFVNLRAA